MASRNRPSEQVWVRGVGARVPSADLITAPTRDDPSGLWTSTWNPRTGGAWIQWCLERDWGARPMELWLLMPHRQARVLVVDDARDAASLDDRYGRDWAGVSHDFDAIRVTERGVERVALPGFVCESTVWFRWSFVRTRFFGEFRPRR